MRCVCGRPWQDGRLMPNWWRCLSCCRRAELCGSRQRLHTHPVGRRHGTCSGPTPLEPKWRQRGELDDNARDGRGSRLLVEAQMHCTPPMSKVMHETRVCWHAMLEVSDTQMPLPFPDASAWSLRAIAGRREGRPSLGADRRAKGKSGTGRRGATRGGA